VSCCDLRNQDKLPRNREEADLFFCSVTSLQKVRNENLVLDNVNDIDLARRIIPTAGRGRVLLTTNEPAVCRIAGLQLELTTLNPDEGADALLALSDRTDAATLNDSEAAHSLSVELGGLLLTRLRLRPTSHVRMDDAHSG
jgi:hypothetical protein